MGVSTDEVRGGWNQQDSTLIQKKRLQLSLTVHLDRVYPWDIATLLLSSVPVNES